jgi:hypothetical protein
VHNFKSSYRFFTFIEACVAVRIFFNKAIAGYGRLRAIRVLSMKGTKNDTHIVEALGCFNLPKNKAANIFQ